MDHTAKRSQRDVFTDFMNMLSTFNLDITIYLIQHLFQLLSQSIIVLDNAFIRQYKNGSHVAVLYILIRSVSRDKEYNIPVSILYPISGKREDAIRIFLIVSKNSTVNKQCGYINHETNEVMIQNLSAWSFMDGLIPIINILQSYFSTICPLYEINPSDVLIPFSELQFFEKLGTGASAFVFRGLYAGREVALKQMRQIPSASEYRFLLREVQTQMRFKHECILDIIGHSETKEGFPILVMELGETSLEDIIITKKQHLSHEVKKKYILDIARALEYLHSYNIVHRDVKLANIIMKGDVAKLADFGFAREIENNRSIQVSWCGSPAMMAPELIDNGKCSTKVDVYSFGCILYEIIKEKHCYFDRGLNRVQVLSHVLNGMRPTIFPGMPLEPVTLMKRCWLEYKQRPAMKEVVQIVNGWNTDLWDEQVVPSMEVEEGEE